MRLDQIIKKPLVTEKSTQTAGESRYVFRVATKANKRQIKRAVEKFFDVTAVGVQTATVRGKKKRIGRRQRLTKAADWKKAFVQLKKGDQIDLFGQEK